MPSTSAETSSNTLPSNLYNAKDCAPNRRLLQKFEGHVFETNGFMQAFKELKKTDEKDGQSYAQESTLRYITTHIIFYNSFKRLTLLASI